MPSDMEATILNDDLVSVIVNGRPKIMNAFQRWMMCRRKIAYGSSSEANATAERLDHTVYDCPLCFSWHTTKQKWRPKDRAA